MMGLRKSSLPRVWIQTKWRCDVCSNDLQCLAVSCRETYLHSGELVRVCVCVCVRVCGMCLSVCVFVCVCAYIHMSSSQEWAAQDDKKQQEDEKKRKRDDSPPPKAKKSKSGKK